ncbi:hypothetical protein [Mangrovibacter yixingensis]|uniref:hypothetical protein n=1 Tax=Mangrovibacter yixingensis TaxID=1529639 RepID=UPI001CFA1AF4|nr:hypothetical protein [Mangrovibacter yixingensis]
MNISEMVNQSLTNLEKSQEQRDEEVNKYQQKLQLQHQLQQVAQQISYYSEIIRGKLTSQPEIYGSDVKQIIDDIVTSILSHQQPQLMSQLKNIKEKLNEL